MGQPSMPEMRESMQLPHPKRATLSSGCVQRVAGKLGSLRGIDVYRCLRRPPAMAVLPVAIAMSVPHAIVPITISIVVTGLVGIIGKYLLFYARNRRARSIAEIRRAAIEGRLAVADAEKLIRADMRANADSQQLEEGNATGEERGPGQNAESSEGLGMRHSSTTEPPAIGRIVLMLRRVHLL